MQTDDGDWGWWGMPVLHSGVNMFLNDGFTFKQSAL